MPEAGTLNDMSIDGRLHDDLNFMDRIFHFSAIATFVFLDFSFSVWFCYLLGWTISGLDSWFCQRYESLCIPRLQGVLDFHN